MKYLSTTQKLFLQKNENKNWITVGKKISCVIKNKDGWKWFKLKT